MVITLDYNLRKLRTWIGELPDARYPATDVVEHTRPAMSSVLSVARKAAVEYYRYTEHILHSLLGATFTPQESGRLLVQVVRSSGAGQHVDWSINPFGQNGRVGLWSSTAVDFIVKSALESAVIDELGSGVLRFECSVEGPPIVMGWLTEAVIVLLARPVDNWTQESLQALMERVGPPFLWPRYTTRVPRE